MENITKYLKRRIVHSEKRLSQCKEQHGDNPIQTHNYFGGRSLGYWEGKLSAYQNTLDEIKDKIGGIK